MDVKVPTIGAQIDRLNALREQKRKAEEVVKSISADYEALQEQILQRLKADGTEKASSKKATVSITSSVVANVIDWDIAWKVISKNPQLMQRRISDPAFRELLKQKGEKWMAKNGFEPFTKTRLNLRSL